MAEQSRSSSYSERLKDPRWAAKREEVFARDGHRCILCSGQSNLQAHHRYYLPDREPWEYPLDAYETLCGACHKITEALLLLLRQGLETKRLKEVVGFVLGTRAFDRPGETIHVAGSAMALGVAAAWALDPGKVVGSLTAGNLTNGLRLAALAASQPGAEEPAA